MSAERPAAPTEHPVVITPLATAGHRPLRTWGRCAAGLIVLATMIWSIALIIRGWIAATVLGDGTRGSIDAWGYYRTIRTLTVVGGLSQLLALAGGVALVVWLYRARCHADSGPGPRPRFASAWAIGAWFVPVANLVLPPLVVAEVRRALHPEQPRGGVALWWGSAIAAQVLLVVGFVVGAGARSALYGQAVLLTLSALASAVSAGALAVVIGTTSRPPGGSPCG